MWNVNRSSSSLRVRYAETDQMGVVYHTHYLVWCEIARTDYIRQFGASYAELERDELVGQAARELDEDLALAMMFFPVDAESRRVIREELLTNVLVEAVIARFGA